jgi:hypothetical protein
MPYSFVPSLDVLTIILMGEESSHDYEADHVDIVNGLYNKLHSHISNDLLAIHVPHFFIPYIHCFLEAKFGTIAANKATQKLINLNSNGNCNAQSIYKKASAIEEYFRAENGFTFYDVAGILFAIECKTEFLLVTKETESFFHQLRESIPAFQKSRNFPKIINIETLNLEIPDIISGKNSSDILVRTPNGVSVFLPVGATPVDYAYKMHSEMGNQCIGAYVNEVEVTLDYKLKKGDIIKITKDESSSAKVEWIEFTLPETKKKIQANIRKASKKTNAATEKILYRMGREAIESHPECRKKEFLRKTYLELDTFAKSQNILDVTCAKDLIVLIGKKEISFSDILEKIKLAQPRRDENEIYILEGIRHKSAACCGPLPGNLSIAVVSENKGMARLHFADCKNLKNVAKSNLKPVEWKNADWDVQIVVIVKNEPDTVRPIFNKIIDLNFIPDIESVQRKSNDRSSVNLRFTVGLTHTLNDVLAVIRQMDKVLDVRVKAVTLAKDKKRS